MELIVRLRMLSSAYSSLADLSSLGWQPARLAGGGKI